MFVGLLDLSRFNRHGVDGGGRRCGQARVRGQWILDRKLVVMLSEVSFEAVRFLVDAKSNLVRRLSVTPAT